jgi:hypothetical protein
VRAEDRWTAARLEIKECSMGTRYVRIWMNGNTSDATNPFYNIQAWSTSGVDVALGCPVILPYGGSYLANYELVQSLAAGASTSVLTEIAVGGSVVLAGNLIQAPTGSPSTGMVILDLGTPCALASIVFWPFFGARSYYDLQVAFSLDYSSWTTVFGPATVSVANVTATTGLTFGPYCFVRGTHIATPRGETRVEDLRVGDVVSTPDGRDVQVVEVTSSASNAALLQSNRPIVIPKGTLGATRDLLLSERHGVVQDGALVVAAAVRGAVRLADLPPDGVVHYHHVRLPAPRDFVLAEGVACESLRDAPESSS